MKCRKCNCPEMVVREAENKHKFGIYCKECGEWVDWGSDTRDIAPNGTYDGIIINAEEINGLFILIHVCVIDFRPLKLEIWRKNGKYGKEQFKGLDCKFNSLEDLIESLKGQAIKARKSNKNTYIV